MSLRFRFLAILISLILIPIVVTGVLVGWWSYNSQQKLVKVYHREMVTLATERLTSFFGRLEHELIFMAANLELTHKSPNQVRSALAQSLTKHQAGDFAFNRFAVTDNRGRVVVGLAKPGPPWDPDWLQMPELTGSSPVPGREQVAYSSVRLLRPSGEPVMTMAQPIFQPVTGAHIGWLSAQVRLGRAWRRVAQMNRDPNVVIYMVDQNNRLVAHPDKTKILKGNTIKIKAGQSTGPGLASGRALLSSKNLVLGDYSFVIVAEQSWYRAFKPILIQLAVVGGLLVISILGIGLAGVLLIKDVVWPLEKLNRAAKQMGGGDLTVRVESGRGDEIGQLSAAFNTMASRLEENMAALRLRIDERARAYRRLDRSFSELEDFTHVASHHLQEPLRKMASFGELLHKRYHSQLDERGQRYLWYIIDGSTRLKQLLEDLLTYSRLSRAELNLTQTDLGDLVSETVAQLQPVIEQQKARITWEALPTARVDRAKFQMVIKALVDNSLKFCDHENPEIHISGETKGDKWALTVTDNGSGVEPAYQAQVFELFKTLHQAGKYPGTGIGLALCRRIIERHKGRLWLESQPDGGSSIRMTLPLNPGGKK